MQAIVPAAGEGTRLRPLTADKPKGLVEVAGQPLLSYVFETLAALPVEEAVVVVGYHGDQIREYYGNSFEGIKIQYVEQPQRRGLADALLRAASAVSGDVVVLNGDNVFDTDLGPVVQRHRETGADATTLVHEVSRERATAGGVFDFEDDELVGMVEKPEEPPSRLVSRGFHVFSEDIFPACRLVTPAHTDEYELTDAIDLLIHAGRTVETMRFDGWCCNVNTPADCERVAAHF
jgi:glucose-1-phosphate thymidylyltransferase